MKIAKALGIILILIVVVLAAGAAYFVATFDEARIKREAVQAVKAKTGRTLVIAGGLGLSFWPSLGVKAEKVTLSERDGKESFVAFESAHVSVRLWPLLSRQVMVDRIELDGLVLILKRDAEGRLNIDDLLQSKDEKQEGAGDDRQKGLPQFDIAGIDVSNARLEWHDQQAKRDIVLSPLDLETGHLKSDAQGMSFRDLKFATRGKLNSDGVDMKLELPRVERRGEKLDIEKLDLEVKLNGAQRKATGTVTLDRIEGTLTALKAASLSLDADAKLGDKTFVAKLASPLTLDLDAGIATLAQLKGTVSVDVPGSPKRPLQLPIEAQLEANYRKPSATGKLKTKFDETNASASFDVSAFSPLAFALDLDIDKLNLDRYLPSKPAAAAKPGGAAAVPAKEEAPIDLSALQTLDARGNVHIGDLQVKNIKARNVRVNFKSAKGRLSLAPHSADLYGGKMSGNASVDAKGNVVSLKESLSGISIQPLVNDLTGKDPIEGHGDVSLDIRTQGESAEVMKKALAGNAKAILRDGAIKGINLAQTLREAKAKLQGGDVAQQASATEKTDFSELSASFRITNGVARNNDLVAKSPFLRVGGKGDIDIGSSRLDYLLTASVVGTSAGQGGKELESLKGVTVPVRITGPFDKPGFKLELASLVNDAAKARIEEKRDETKQKLQENLKGRLKGLFEK